MLDAVAPLRDDDDHRARVGLPLDPRPALAGLPLDVRPARAVPPLPVLPGLQSVLPQGLRRGSTVSVCGSMSLTLALLGAASAGGAWCALVGLPRISAEAATEYGIDTARLAIVPRPGPHWTTTVGALLDAVDIVVACPPRGRAGPAPADVRRLSARVRTRDAVLVAHGIGPAPVWPGAEVRLTAHDGMWEGIGAGYGRLTRRRLTVTVEGRGPAARPRRAVLHLPAAGGGVAADTTPAPVTRLPPARPA